MRLDDAAIQQFLGTKQIALLATVLSNRLGHDGAVLGAPATRLAGLAAFHDTWVVAALLALVASAIALLIEDRMASATYGPRNETQAVELEAMVA